MTEPLFSARIDETLAWLESADVLAAQGVEAKARHLLLDTVACAIGGFRYAEPRAFAENLASTMAGEVRWPGLANSLNPGAAAAVFAMAACWHEACEGLARAHGRPGLHAVPIALAFGLARRATLGEILEAIIWGYEIGGRAGESMRIAPGLHVDGTWGLLAAVAAMARLSQLNVAQTMNALAIAACQIPQSLYRPIKSGDAARNTYVAHAMLVAESIAAAAQAGITAPPDALDEAARQLGKDRAASPPPCAPAGEFLILQGYLKPFAAVRHVHYGAACALRRWSEKGSDTRNIRALTLGIYGEAITYCGNRAPHTPIKAQFSLSYGLASVLRTGTFGPDAYTSEALSDPERIRLEALVSVVDDPAIEGRGAWLRVETNSGDERYAVSSVPGDPTAPLSEIDLRAKASAYMRGVLSDAEIASLCSAVLGGARERPVSLHG